MAVKVETPAKRPVGIAATVILFVLAGGAGCVNLTLPRELGQGRDAPALRRSRARRARAGGRRCRQPDPAPRPRAGARRRRGPGAGHRQRARSPIGGGEKLVNGRPCAEGSQCGSGQCVDGVCCASACPGACQACNVEGSAGTCMPVPAGQDPDNECAEDPPAGCQRDGACDGSGGCRLYPAGVECQPGRCEGATEYAARTCDGKGICRAGSSKSCAPNVCTGNSCGARCTQQSDCQTGFYCAAGTCQPRLARGKDCTAASQCQSGNCADGVCCDLPCTQGCFTCALPSSRGTCQPVPAGQDPRAQCPAQSAADLRAAGRLQRPGQLPPARRRHHLHLGQLHERHAPAPPASATASAPAPPGTKSDCGAYACNGSVCGTSCGTATPSASPACLHRRRLHARPSPCPRHAGRRRAADARRRPPPPPMPPPARGRCCAGRWTRPAATMALDARATTGTAPTSAPWARPPPRRWCRR